MNCLRKYYQSFECLFINTRTKHPFLYQ